MQATVQNNGVGGANNVDINVDSPLATPRRLGVDNSNAKLANDAVYLFGKEAPNNKKDLNINNADMKSLLGGKGANLEVMSKIGLSVPVS